MNVFSYHIVKTSYLSALTAMLFPPRPTNVPGLIHAECMFVMTLGAPVFSPSRILMRQLVLFAQWESEAALDHFLNTDKVAGLWAKGWHTRLLFLRQWGTISEFKIPSASQENDDSDGPVVAVTLARMQLPEVPRFIRWGRPVEKLVRDHPGTILSLASIRLPRTVSTFSVWKSQKEMTDMVRGHSLVPDPKRHWNAMKERERKDFHFEFTTLRFKPISEFGEWNGQKKYHSEKQIELRMRLAYPSQKFQDWLTQQWVILRGRKIDPQDFSWLVGPFGNAEAINKDFIYQLAEKESLTVERDGAARGLISSMNKLNLPETEFSKLPKAVIHFYEHTGNYDLGFSVKWNPFFRFLGILINKLFSNRINQLNIPTRNIKNTEPITSEIITLLDPECNQVKYTFWLRTIQSTGQVIYSGVYGIGTLPSGTTCIKAVFPLPNGNATVFMTPGVGKNGELILDSSGKKFGDAGFYFLLKDSKEEYWSQFIPSFKDRLTIRAEKNLLFAEQILTLWHVVVLRFNYTIEPKQTGHHHPTANHL